MQIYEDWRKAMSRSSKKIIKLLAACALCAIMLMGMVMPTMAAPTIDREELGTLTLLPMYNSATVAGGTFTVYHVATIDDAATLGYTLKGVFANAARPEAEGGSNININDITSDAKHLAAAVALRGLTSNTAQIPAEDIKTLDRATDGDLIEGLALGIHLVVNNSMPGYYTVAAPFLVFIPSPVTNENNVQTGWTYDVTAHPKVGYDEPYNPPDDPEYSVSVTKVWNDAGFEASRPASIQVALFNGTTQQGSAITLPRDNGSWSYTWGGLPAGNWTVQELSQTSGYFSTITNNGYNFTITNNRDDVPLSEAISVTKVWVGDNPATRPASVSATLYRNGEAYETVTLNEGNRWSHSWIGLSSSYTWTVRETAVPTGYTSRVTQSGGSFTITNSVGGGDDPDDDIIDPDVPLADIPQTGMLQWPIPVLSMLGIGLITCGATAGRAKKKRED